MWRKADFLKYWVQSVYKPVITFFDSCSLEFSSPVLHTHKNLRSWKTFRLPGVLPSWTPENPCRENKIYILRSFYFGTYSFPEKGEQKKVTIEPMLENFRICNAFIALCTFKLWEIICLLSHWPFCLQLLLGKRGALRFLREHNYFYFMVLILKLKENN